MTSMSGQGAGPEPVAVTDLGGLGVSRLGLGCMVLTRSHGRPDEAEALATLELALDRGVCFLDTADSYSGGDNERFVARVLRRRRSEAVLASKFGLVATAPSGTGGIAIDGRPEYVRACCEASLRRLGTDHIDLYYQHRVDPAVPVTETVGAMAELVAAGKVRHLGLCEVSAAELEAAHGVHPITAVQSEWSLWARQIETELLPTARRLGVGIVPYSPLGRGFLAGAIRTEEVIGSGDVRSGDPRLKGEHLRHNLGLVVVLEDVAAERGATPAQVAIAWLLAQGDDVVPIPGIERPALLDEDLGALGVGLTSAELTRLEAAFAPGAASGNPDETLLRSGR
jgi:aryl-alcohol dehydrogenase-like predicted oxidoreductase